MSCTKPIDPDEGNMNTCGDEGRLCFDCRCEEYAYWRNLYNRAPLSETNPEQYRQDMIDAGRSHLLPDVMADRIDRARMREKDAWILKDEPKDDLRERGDENANQ